jgi:hypothetical protein
VPTTFSRTHTTGKRFRARPVFPSQIKNVIKKPEHETDTPIGWAFAMNRKIRGPEAREKGENKAKIALKINV